METKIVANATKYNHCFTWNHIRGAKKMPHSGL